MTDDALGDDDIEIEDDYRIITMEFSVAPGAVQAFIRDMKERFGRGSEDAMLLWYDEPSEYP